MSCCHLLPRQFLRCLPALVPLSDRLSRPAPGVPGFGGRLQRGPACPVAPLRALQSVGAERHLRALRASRGGVARLGRTRAHTSGCCYAVFGSHPKQSGGMNNTAPRPAQDGQLKTGAAEAPRPLDAGAVTKRLQQELMSLMVGGDHGISAFPDGDSLFSWVGTITGGAGTVYEGLTYRLSFKFTSEYPFKPPTVRFETPCFHPNVDQYGNICLDILKDKWSAAHSVRTLLVSIQSLLADPNVDSPLNAHAAKLWGCDQEYKQMVLKTFNSPPKAA